VESEEKQSSHRKNNEDEEKKNDTYIGQFMCEVKAKEISKFAEKIETKRLEVSLK
jgi:hypothetical protein